MTNLLKISQDKKSDEKQSSNDLKIELSYMHELL